MNRSNGVGLPKQEDALRNWIAKTDPYTIAYEMDHAPEEQRVQAFDLLPPEHRLDIFRHLTPHNQAGLLERLDEERSRTLLNAMEPDDRVRLFATLSEQTAQRFLNLLDPAELSDTRLLLHYPEESAGRLMSPAFITLKPGLSVAEAMAQLRRESEQAETLYLLPVTEADGVLRGAIELRDLVLAEPEQSIDGFIKDVAVVSPFDDQEVVARLIKTADLVALPVVEEHRRLVGLITFDDAMEILEFEEGEDFARTGGSEPVGKPYLSLPISRLVRSRIIWLSVLAVAATLTVNVLSAFESTLETVVTLSLFIPLLIGIGGNTGAQSATTVVRALAVDDVRGKDFLRVANREARTGLALGSLIGLIAFVVVWLLFDRDIALIVAATLVAICTMAALVGAVMPIVARTLNVDPAVFSAPFVTTIVDASGLLVYFLIAKTVLGI